MEYVLIGKGRAGDRHGKGLILRRGLIGERDYDRRGIIYIGDRQREARRRTQMAGVGGRDRHGHGSHMIVERRPAERAAERIETQPGRERRPPSQCGVIAQGVPVHLIHIRKGCSRHGERERRIFHRCLVGQRTRHRRHLIHIGHGQRDVIGHGQAFTIRGGHAEIERAHLRIVWRAAECLGQRSEAQPRR